MSNPEILLPEGEIIKITDGIVDWLQTERNVSNIDRNSYLDQLDEQLKFRALPIDDPANQMVNKLFSHIQRLPVWFEAFSEDPTDDYQTGKMIFSPLMLLSGRYREQLLFQAKDQEDYYRRKSSLGDLNHEVSDAVSHRINTLGHTELDLPTLKATARFCIDAAVKEAEEVNLRAASGIDFGKEESPSVSAIRSSERLWTEFIADLIVFARQVRNGNLAAVPFLEAKSISDEPKVYYPFAV